MPTSFNASHDQSQANAPDPLASSSFVSDEQRQVLQEGLDSLPEEFEPMAVDSLDGYLCGVLLQPYPVNPENWLKYLFDIEGRQIPASFDTTPWVAIILKRFDELAFAIKGRQWFDPWIFELTEKDNPQEAVYPWVAGFATALTLFPGIDELSDTGRVNELIAPLALIYRHLDPSDLDDADELVAEIESLEPLEDLSQAVEDLVRGCLLLADQTQTITSSQA